MTYARDFKVGDRVVTTEDWLGPDVPGTIIDRYYFRDGGTTEAWIIQFDDAALIDDWASRDGRQQENMKPGTHAFHEDFLAFHVDVNTSDINEVEAFLNG